MTLYATKQALERPNFGAFRDDESLPDKKSCASVKNDLTGLARQGYSAPVKKRTYTAAEVIALLRKMQGNKRDFEFAAELGISHPYLCDLYKGRRTPGEKVLRHLGLVKLQPEPVYEVA